MSDEVRWKEGAKNFRLFFEDLKVMLLSSTIPSGATHQWLADNKFDPEDLYSYLPNRSIASLQALFLGEKPAILDLYERTTNVPVQTQKQIYQELEKYGFLREGRFIYNPALVQKIVDTYSDT